MGNETNRTAQNEEAVQNTHAEVVLCLLRRESAAVSEKVNKADGNASVNIQDQVILLGSGDSLDSDRIIEQLVRSEVLRHEFLNKLHSEIGVVSGLDSVTDTRDYHDC